MYYDEWRMANGDAIQQSPLFTRKIMYNIAQFIDVRVYVLSIKDMTNLRLKCFVSSVIPHSVLNFLSASQN